MTRCSFCGLWPPKRKNRPTAFTTLPQIIDRLKMQHQWALVESRATQVQKQPFSARNWWWLQCMWESNGFSHIHKLLSYFWISALIQSDTLIESVSCLGFKCKSWMSFCKFPVAKKYRMTCQTTLLSIALGVQLKFLSCDAHFFRQFFIASLSSSTESRDCPNVLWEWDGSPMQIYISWCTFQRNERDYPFEIFHIFPDFHSIDIFRRSL